MYTPPLPMYSKGPDFDISSEIMRKSAVGRPCRKKSSKTVFGNSPERRGAPFSRFWSPFWDQNAPQDPLRVPFSGSKPPSSTLFRPSVAEVCRTSLSFRQISDFFGLRKHRGPDFGVFLEDSRSFPAEILDYFLKFPGHSRKWKSDEYTAPADVYTAPADVF